MSDPYREGPEAARARRLRNLAIGGVLVAFVLLIFVITIIRLGSNALQPHF
jgi:hypothetical protein